MIIVGANGHVKDLLDIIESRETSFCFFDNISKNLDPTISAKYKILRSESDAIDYLKKDSRFALGIGGPVNRYKMSNLFKIWKGELTSLISPHSIIGKTNVNLGKGQNIMHNAVIYNCVAIGEGCIIHTGASIHHDTVIGNYTEISPGARMGNCRIGDFCHIGGGTLILPGITIGNNVTTCVGSVITKDIESNSIVAGAPARKIRTLEPLI